MTPAAPAGAPPPVPGLPAPASAPLPLLAILGLSLAAMASGVSMRVTDAMLPRLAEEFSVSIGEASHVITTFAVAYGLAQLVFGPLGDRYGKYRVIAAACAVSSLTALLCGFAADPLALAGARLLAGMTAAAVIPLSMAWIGDVVPYERRQPVLARFLIGQIFGFAGGVWLGGYAAEHLDWRAPFFVISAFFAVVAVVLQAVRRTLPAQAVQAGQGAALTRMAGEFRAVIALPWARVVLLTVFLEGAAMFGAFAFVAAHLHLRFGLPLSTVGALVMAYAVGGLVFALGAKALVHRLGERALVHWGALAMAVSLLAIAFGTRWWWAIPACALMGMGFYMMHNTLQVQATQMAPQRRGAAVAAFASCLFLGQSAGVGLAGLLVGPLGTSWIMAIGAAGLLAVAWNFNRQRLRQAPVAARAA